MTKNESPAAAPAAAPETQGAAPVTAPEPPAAAAAGVSVDANGVMRAPGAFSRLLGQDGQIKQLQAQLTAEREAHASTREQLTAVQGRVAEYERMEGELSAAITAQEEADRRAEEATGKAAAAAATVKAAEDSVASKVASGVTDALASLGVPEASLPGAEAPEGEKKTELEGKARAAAAFSAKIAAVSGK